MVRPFSTCEPLREPGHLIGSVADLQEQRSKFRSFPQVRNRALSGPFRACSYVRPKPAPLNQFVPRGLMDHVQLADSPHGRGCHKMSDTDTRNVLTVPAERPSALGDLRFAGTI